MNVTSGVGIVNPHLADVQRAAAPSTPVESSAGSTAPAPPAMSVDGVELSVEPRPGALRSLGIGAMALLSLGTALAASPAHAAGLQPVVSSISSTLPAHGEAIVLPTGLDAPKAEAKAGWRVDVGASNDSFEGRPASLVSQKDRIPGLDQTDDNGWTAGFRVDATRTEGNKQTVVTGRFDFLTERGSWDPPEDYGARRQDLLQVAVQNNERTPLGEDGKTRLITGFGLGVQAVGPLGGYSIQNGWHELGWFGGRVGAEHGLQTHYTSDHVRLAPLVTGGVGIEHDLDIPGHVTVKGAVTGNLALGEGPSSARAQVSIAAMPTSWFRTEVGANVDVVRTQGHSLDYMQMDGTRPGWFFRIEGTSNRWVTPFFHVEAGGLKNEVNYTVGISIPLGGGSARPWLDPIHR